jgi:sec-independent protein translocase protein TatA
MGAFSAWHWIVVLVVVILLFGGKKIPELAKGLGKGIKTFKAEMKEDEAAVKTAESPKEVDATASNGQETTKSTTQA